MARLTLLVAMIFLSACSYQDPTLKLADVRTKDRSDSGVVLAISVDAENRNHVELPLKEIRYIVTLDSGQTFSGVRSPEASLRRLGTQTIQFPAVFAATPESPAPSGTVHYQISGTLDYVTPGEFARVLYDARLHRPSASFRGEGEIDLGK